MTPPAPDPIGDDTRGGSEPASTPRKARTAARWAFAGVGLLLMLATAAAVSGYALLRTTSGTHWLLNQLPGVRVANTNGGLLSPRFEAASLRVAWGDRGAHVDVQRLQWEGLRVHFGPRPGQWARVHWPVLTAETVTLHSGTPDDSPLTAPGSLRLPMEVVIDRLQVGQLTLASSATLTGLQAQVAVGDKDGAAHRFVLDKAQTRAGTAAVALKGEATIATDAPMAVDLTLEADAAGAERPWSAQARARGPLASIETALLLKGQAPSPSTSPGTPPAVEAKAQIRPFERWPLGAVSATTHDLDLASLLPEAPRTRLSGHLVVQSLGLRDPITADLQFNNTAAASWSTGGLPLLAARLRVETDPRHPERLRLSSFEWDAADSQGSAGRWTGTGQWDSQGVQLDTRLTDLQPARLDQRLAAMRLSGPLRLQIRGLPSPWGRGPQPAAAAASAASPEALLQADLQGRIAGAPEEVSLAVDLQASQQRLRIERLQARSGRATLSAQAQLARAGGTRWQLTTQGQLDSFDPVVWFPGHPLLRGAAGSHRLNGAWAIDVSAPAPGTGILWSRWLPQWQGQADARLADSTWAGLPLGAELSLRQDDRGTDAPSRAQVALRLGSTRLTLTGAGQPRGDGSSDRSSLSIEAPALAELGPLFKAHPGLTPWAPRQGQLRLRADLSGRWPAVTFQWQAQAAQLQAGVLSVAQGSTQGRWDRAGGDAVDLRAEATGVRWQHAELQQGRLLLSGTAPSHRFDIDAAGPLQAPAALTAALIEPPHDPGGITRARLSGQGRWQAEAAGGGRWRFGIDLLDLGREGPSGAPASRARWLAAQALSGDLSWDEGFGLTAAALQPGRLQSGVLGLSWQEAVWQRGPEGGPPRFSLKARVDPLELAPVLNRLEERLGDDRATGDTPSTARSGQGAAASAAPKPAVENRWAGDLRLAATIDVQASPALEARVQLARTGGDLLLRDAGSEQALGIGQAELTLDARNGLWRLRPAFSGRSLGLLDGDIQLRAANAESWPEASSPLAGRLKAEVTTLAAWGAWLPPGWRLLGAAQVQAALGGSLSAPQLTGDLQGQNLALRNPLQGVDLRDGNLRVVLTGETALIEQATVRGGAGTLSVDGQARLGSQPQFGLTARARQLRVLGRLDRQLTVSGELAVKGSPQGLQVDGKVKADNGFFDLSQRDAPTLDEDVDVRRPGEPERDALARREPGTLARQLRLAVDLDLGQQLRLRGRGLDTLLQGGLKLSAPAGRLAVQGQVKAVDGTYAAYGQKLGIERGLVFFEGPLDRTRLDILALRPNLDVRVGVAISGPAQEPRVRLVSEPELPDSDKLSWLVLGRGPDGLGRTDTALLQRAAMALLAGEGQGPADGLMRRLGIDDFAIRQTDGDARDTVVSVGKQLSRRWYVGYERGVNAATGTWQLVYRIAQRFTLRAQSGTDNSLDMIWTWRFATQAQRRQGEERP